MKFFSNKDLSWPAFAGALALTFIVINAFRGPLPGGDFSERAPVLAEYLGVFLFSLCFAGVLVAILWAIRRSLKKPYETPRRDMAIATLLMMLVTFKNANATVPDVPAASEAPVAIHRVV